MRIGIVLSARFWCMLVGVAVLLAPISKATTHVIQFGGSVGFTYSPSTLAVTVGDTIEWQGNFGFHPLSSTTIPQGASPWQNSSGTRFQYIVPVAGTYNYHCDSHFASGMAGSFTASVTGISDQRTLGNPFSFTLQQNYPNPFNPTTTISYTLPSKSYVTLGVYNLAGQKTADIVTGQMEAGFHQAVFDASGLPSGVYFYRLSAESFTQTRKLLLLR